MFQLVHQEIDLKSFHSESPTELRRSAYKSGHIAETLCKVAKMDATNFFTFQRSVLKDYNFHREHTSYLSLETEDDDERTRMVLESYFRRFDFFFFLGGLRRYTEIVLRPRKNRSHRKRDRRGKTKWTNKGKFHLKIKIYKRRRGTLDQLLDDYLGTLLHEMVHGFFYSFACTGPCCNYKAFSNLGGGGHGTRYIDVANAIELSVTRTSTFNLTLDLGILSSLVREMLKSKVDMISKEQREKWDLHKETIQLRMERWKAHESDIAVISSGRRRG